MSALENAGDGKRAKTCNQGAFMRLGGKRGAGVRGTGSRGMGSRGVENAGCGKRGVWWKTRGKCFFAKI